MSKIVQLDDHDFGVWEQFLAQKKYTRPDSVQVGFSKRKKYDDHTVQIRIGSEILEKMRWSNDDRIGLFLSKKDKYTWMLCASSIGYKLTDTNSKSNRKISLNWPHAGVTYTKAKEVRFDINKEQLILHIPM